MHWTRSTKFLSTIDQPPGGNALSGQEHPPEECPARGSTRSILAWPKGLAGLNFTVVQQHQSDRFRATLSREFREMGHDQRLGDRVSPAYRVAPFPRA